MGTGREARWSEVPARAAAGAVSLGLPYTRMACVTCRAQGRPERGARTQDSCGAQQVAPHPSRSRGSCVVWPRWLAWPGGPRTKHRGAI